MSKTGDSGFIRRRAVFDFLLFYEEKTVKEVAAQLGYSRKTITNRKKAVLQKLKRIMEL